MARVQEKFWDKAPSWAASPGFLHSTDWAEAGWSLGAKHISKHCLLLCVMNLLFCVSVSASTSQFKFGLILGLKYSVQIYPKGD